MVSNGEEEGKGGGDVQLVKYDGRDEDGRTRRNRGVGDGGDQGEDA